MPTFEHRRLRAPTADGAALVDPPLQRAPLLVGKNRVLTFGHEYDCQGMLLRDMALEARQQLAQQAIDYSAQYRDARFVPSLSKNPPFILAGHQPELFHPGVWFKSFLLSTLGRQLDAVPVNLIIDTDVVHSTSIRVPASTGNQRFIEKVAFDAASGPIPFEERRILDPWMFDSFDQRVAAAFASYGDLRQPYKPLIQSLWAIDRAAKNHRDKHPLLGRVLAQARHEMEWSLGLQTLELPLSEAVKSDPFRRFAVHLLAQMPQFWRVYNAALAHYRHVNHLRSSTHPVPSLQEHDDWLEAPFFVWTAADPRRRPLFVQQRAKSLILHDRHGLELSLDIAPDGPADVAIEQLSAAESRGIKLRPRALITTMYARLVLSNLFIHGIGGAKYDELTDLIIRRFFGIEPPAYVTATATFRLPIDRPSVSLDDVRASARRIRDLRHSPESFLRDPRVAQDADLAPKLASLTAEKREFLGRHDLRRCSQDVFDRLNLLNLAMNDLLTPLEQQLRAEHTELIALAKQSGLLGSREFSFVLFPSVFLPARLLDLSKNVS